MGDAPADAIQPSPLLLPLHRHLDDDAHQALDLLDELPLARLWVAARSDEDPRVGDELRAAIEAADEDPQAVLAAAERVRPGLVALLAVTAGDCLDAARALLADPQAGAANRGRLRAEDLEAAAAELAIDPSRAPILATAVELTGMGLGLQREGAAWGELIVLGEQARAGAPDHWLRCSEALADRMQAPTAADARPLRVLRSAAARHAGPELQARILAGEGPEHLPLARRLVAAIDDPAERIARFDEARAALEASASAAGAAEEPNIDGPKRRFTWLHAILALIVLGLTVWHYWLR